MSRKQNFLYDESDNGLARRQRKIFASLGCTRQFVGHQPYDGANSRAFDDFAAYAQCGFGDGGAKNIARQCQYEPPCIDGLGFGV